MRMKIQLAIKNFKAQDDIFNAPVRYKIVVKGRRFGLTRGKANNFIHRALKKEFKAGLWVDTVNTNIDKYVDRYFLPHLSKLPKDQYEWQKQAKTLYIRNSYIDFRSADRPENFEGFGYEDVFLNEAGIILKDEYLWNNAIRPMLWEYKSPAVIGGTPKGVGLFKQLAERGKDPGQPRYKYFHFSTFDNPYLDKAEIEQEIKDMPERVVKQEIFAEFLEDTGVVFRNISKVATAAPEKPKPGHLYVMGVDLAKVQDWTVLTVYDRSTNTQVYQDRFQKLDWPYQKTKIYETAKHYNNALIPIDATGVGDPIADDLLRMGLSVIPIKLTNQVKKELIEKLVLYTEQERIHLLPLTESLSEFNNFTYDISSTGRIMYSAPPGFHDDIVISHALAASELHPLQPLSTPRELTPIQQALLQAKRNHYEEYDN